MMWGKERKQKKALIEENGSWLHEELITTFNGRHKVPLHFFTAKDLMGVRNKFIHPINRNPYIKFSQGCLDQCSILVKTLLPNKFQHLNSRQAQIHDIVITSQMSHHKNVWKLLGCCLEFEVPVMVYEYDTHFDILADLLYDSCATDDTSRRILAWTSRLRIANDIGNAIVYLHMAFPTPIIYRKIIPHNIIIDQRGVAKLFDYSHSILLPPGELELEVDSMVGVHAFMPPEYVRFAIVSQKTDVYTFGVLLLALLTGRNASVEPQILENSPNSLSDCLAGKELHEFVGPDIMGPQGVVEQEKQQLQAFLQLALKCVQYDSEDRPEMIEVARELRLMMKYSGSTNPNAPVSRFVT